MENKCICGRAYTHCRKCGARSVYVKKLRSLELQETVVGCRTCGCESKNSDECQAPPREFNSGFVTASPRNPLEPTDGIALGSPAHALCLNDWVIAMQSKNGWGPVEVYIEAQKAGWHLEFFGDKLDTDVKQALIDRGLWPEQVVNNQLEAPMRGAQDTQSPPITAPVESAVSLDEIIKNMQENAK